MAEEQKIYSFENLRCYQLGMELVHAAYHLGEILPAYEKYNLASQLRRAAVSNVLNIAEGYGRFHYLDKIRYFYIARGSLSETLAGFICANQVGYITSEQLAETRGIVIEAEKSLNGYIHFIRQQKQGASEYGDRFFPDHDPEHTDLSSN